MKLIEVKYITRDFDRRTIKRIVRRLSNGKFVQKNSGPNTFYYDVPNIKIALDNLNAQFGQPWAAGPSDRERGLVYYIWIVSGWKVKLSDQDIAKLEVWQSGEVKRAGR